MSKGMTRSDGLMNTICSNNWGDPPFKIAKGFRHNCLHHKCENGRGNFEKCYGADHHMMLCDICGAACRTSHGCNWCENSPECINMVIMGRWNGRIDPQEDWRKYVEAVNKQEYYAEIYPELVYNTTSWQADLHAHILFRRRLKFGGTENKEREKAQQDAKKPRDVYGTRLRERQTAGCKGKQKRTPWNDTRSLVNPGSMSARRRPLPPAGTPTDVLVQWLLDFALLVTAPVPAPTAPSVANGPGQRAQAAQA